MSNKKYTEIKIPSNIDEKIATGVQEAVLEKSKRNRSRRKKVVGTIAASLVAVVTLGISNPALAAKLPVIGSVFEAIEKNIHFPGNYSQYSTSINETAYSNGVGITLSEILCDGQSLYVTYIVENEEPFKYTSWGDSGLMDMEQLITAEAYSKVDFTDEELDSSGFAGLEGKFIDETTFVGVQKYNLISLESEIPDQFTFQTKINVIENYGINADDISYYKWGTWAFKVPVTVNKDLRMIIDLTESNVESDVAKINSLSITPFDMIIDIDYKSGIWSDYRCLVYDENGQKLDYSLAKFSDDMINERIIFQAPNMDSNSIRLVITKAENKIGDTPVDEAGIEIFFDEIIPIK